MPASTFDEHVAIMAAESPRGLVLDWWHRLDMTLDDIFAARGLCRPESRAAIEAAIATDSCLPEGFATRIQNLRLERNRTAHQRDLYLTGDGASQYATRVFAAIRVLFATL